MNIYLHRIYNQQISKSKFKTPAEVLSWLGGIQGQDFSGAKWSIGLRLQNFTESEIEQEINKMTIVKSWLMRGTLHFAASKDIRWLLELLAPKIIKGGAGRFKQLELDDSTFKKSRKLIIKFLKNRNQYTRNEIFTMLNKSGISTAGQRGIHILWKFALDRLICYGPIIAKQQTFVLLDEWMPDTKNVERSRALAELAKIYFFSRGPATLQDFVWWSGLKISDAQIGLDAIMKNLDKEILDGIVYWYKPIESVNKKNIGTFMLPGFDEYLLGYKNKYGTLDQKYIQLICPGKNGLFNPTIINDGQLIGIWKRVFKKNMVIVAPEPFTQFSEVEKKSITKSANLFGKYLEMPVEIYWNSKI